MTKLYNLESSQADRANFTQAMEIFADNALSALTDSDGALLTEYANWTDADWSEMVENAWIADEDSIVDAVDDVEEAKAIFEAEMRSAIGDLRWNLEDSQDDEGRIGGVVRHRLSGAQSEKLKRGDTVKIKNSEAFGNVVAVWKGECTVAHARGLKRGGAMDTRTVYSNDMLVFVK